MDQKDFRNLEDGSVVMLIKANSETASEIIKIPSGTLLVRKSHERDSHPGIVGFPHLLNFEYELNGETLDNFFYADEVQLVKE